MSLTSQVRSIHSHGGNLGNIDTLALVRGLLTSSQHFVHGTLLSRFPGEIGRNLKFHLQLTLESGVDCLSSFCICQIGVASRTTSWSTFSFPRFFSGSKLQSSKPPLKRSHLNVVFHDRQMAIIVCPGIHSVGAALKSEVSR
jgi:hypothetical protein